MTLFKISSFAGEVPKTAPEKLPASAAAMAKNCRLTSGNIEPWRGLLAKHEVKALSEQIKTIYYYRPSALYLTFTEHTDVLPSPIAQDVHGRLYLSDATNGAMLAVKDDIDVDGYGRTVISTRALGVDEPTDQPVLSGSGGSSSIEEARSVVYTFVSDLGEEGPPSPAAATVTVLQDDTLTVTGMEVPTDTNITKKRLYLTSVGTAGANFQFWAEVDYDDTTYSAAVDPLDLAETLPSTYWTKAPTGLHGLVALNGNFFAGFVGNEVWFSEPGYPHAWPISYMLTFVDDIVALGVEGSTLIVLTEARVYIVSAPSPETATVSTFPDIIPCASARSVSLTPTGVIFASEDGLYMANSGGVTKVTQDYFTKPQWEALYPSSIVGSFQNGYYVFFYNGEAGYVFSTLEDASSRLSRLDFSGTAVAALKPFDELAIAHDSGASQIVSWFDADETSAMYHCWMSRIVIAPHALNFSCLQVTMDEYTHVEAVPDPPDDVGGPLGVSMIGEFSIAGDWWTSYYAQREAQEPYLKVSVYADGNLTFSSEVLSDAIMVLPGGFRERKWQVGVEGNRRVQMIAMATGTTELMTGPLMPGSSV